MEFFFYEREFFYFILLFAYRFEALSEVRLHPLGIPLKKKKKDKSQSEVQFPTYTNETTEPSKEFYTLKALCHFLSSSSSPDGGTWFTGMGIHTLIFKH